jgi:hypothetical protein
MFPWLLWRIMNTAKGTRERSELGQTEATVPDACPPADHAALDTPVHDEAADQTRGRRWRRDRAMTGMTDTVKKLTSGPGFPALGRLIVRRPILIKTRV